jgi:hypothetical protein
VDAEVNSDKVEEEYEEFQEVGPPLLPAKIPLDSQMSSTSSSSVPEEYTNLSLPFSELKTVTVKCGPLWRKEKFIFLEQWRRCWAGIYGHVVLLYNSERDAKPNSSFDIKGFEARPLTVISHKDPKKKDSAFEIVCPGKKTYQFIARTAKDMNQWVTAIGLASTQPTPTIPLRMPDKTAHEKRRLPSIPDSDSETYDDVDSTIKSNNDRQQNYEPVQSDEEEIYHDISDVCLGGLAMVLVSATAVQGTEDQPPVPPRRPVPPIPDDSLLDQEEMYDDVGAASPVSVYCNMLGAGGEELPPKEPEKCQTVNKEGEKQEEELEEIYDDIGVTEKAPEAMTLSSFHREVSSGSGGRIQHIIKKMEASLGSGSKPTVGYHPKPAPAQQMESEELYEPIENTTVEISRTLP